MASRNIALMNAVYNDVPAVQLPISGGGTATFTEVTDTTAQAADVATGKYFYTAAGVRTQGTNSGGGGGGSGLTLLSTTSLGTLSTTSTSAMSTGKSIAVTGSAYLNYDLLIVDVSVDSTTNDRHTSTVSFVFCTGTSNVASKGSYSVGGNKWNSKLSSSGTGTTRQSTTAYGIYANSVTVSGTTMTIPLNYRYNSNNTGTINGTYTARVYGVKLYDLIGG